MLSGLIAHGAVATPGGNVATCRPSDAPKDQPTGGNSLPPQAPSYFAKDFPTITDSRLGFPIGGLGGIRAHAPLRHTPIVFVHGNQADAQNWLAVMLQMQNLAGYSMQEMYAISYNGLGNFYAGSPAGAAPTQPDQDYFQQHPEGFANGGHGAADDDEVPDLCRFVEAVQAYTGSKHVDIVAHSLGVTVARKFMADYPSLARDVTAFVSVAGANHGTTVCRGVESSYYGCNEISPGSPWLAALNKDESPGPTSWMTVYNGGAGDPFFDPPLDEDSPALQGAFNKTYPGQYHNDLRVQPTEVDDYLVFLLRRGQTGGPTRVDRQAADRIAASHPDGRGGELCGIPDLTGC